MESRDQNGGFAPPSRPWPLLRSFAGWRPSDLGPDLVAGLTLTAIAVPEQMATARLGGFAPQIGFLAIVAGAVGFAIFGANRAMSVGADSTITPIFAGSLVVVATAGSPHYFAAAATLALLVGALLIVAGALRLGWIADLLSIPVTTGFLAGVAGHIVLSQAPALLGVPAPTGAFFDRAAVLAASVGQANILTIAIGIGVLVAMNVCERISPRIPGALIALAVATALVAGLGLESHGVAVLGRVSGALPTLKLPDFFLDDLTRLLTLALLVALVVMVQTAATTRSFPNPGGEADVNRDFLGVGAASALAGLMGAFPLNASPPRTAVVAQTGGVSQLGALFCAGLVLLLSIFGAGLFTYVPQAALAGVLLFVAQRITRISVFLDVGRRSLPEFALAVVTMAGIVLLPIEQGVAVGVVLSLLHGVWTTTRARAVELARIPGTTIWWPETFREATQTAPGVVVIAPQAPLSFLNAHDFQRAVLTVVAKRGPSIRLAVIEANSVVEIDYTGGRMLEALVLSLREQGVAVAFARIESVRARQALTRLGLEDLIGADHLFHSVEEAVRALGP